MLQKITSSHQLASITIGSLIHKFPREAAPEQYFDALRAGEIDIYEVTAFLAKEGIWKLLQVNKSVEIFIWPQDIEYLKISSTSLVADKVWWIKQA